MHKNDFDFCKEFSTDEEVNDTLDAFNFSVANEIAKEDAKTSIAIPHKIERVLCTYKLMKYLTRGKKGVKVSCKLYEPYTSMGSVSVVGKDISFKNPEWFLKAAELSSNFEVYPKTDGTIQMNFTFHGLTRPIE